MRRLAALALFLPLLPLLAVLTVPQTSAAADFPAFADGGSICTVTDAGFAACCTSRLTGGWNAVVRCQQRNVNYVACRDATCTVTRHNTELTADITYDLGMPGGHDTICVATFDGGTPSCTINYKRDRGE